MSLQSIQSKCLDIDPKTQGYLQTHLTEKLKKIVKATISKTDNNIFNAAYRQEKNLIVSNDGLYVLKSASETEVSIQIMDISSFVSYPTQDLGVIYRQQIEVDDLVIYDEKNIVNIINLAFSDSSSK